MGRDEITFGRFRLDLRRRGLLCDGKPLRLGGRALDILCTLASAGGDVVSKDALMARVWAGRAVEEGNLHVHISVLRKALDDHGEGHGYIVTIPGRGYRFAPAVTRSDQAAPAAPALALSDKPSIVVLPFANLSGDPEQDYFADGMAEEVIAALSRIPWLFVIARNSSRSYKGSVIDLKQIGRDLGVRYVLEGSVRKDGNRVRITGQLIGPGTLANAAQALAYFDEDIRPMMALVDRALMFNPSYARGWHISGTLRLWAGLPEIAIKHMEVALRLSPRARIGLSLAAIGRAHVLTRSFTEAIPKLLLAIQEDPSFPNPYCSLAICYAHMGRIDSAREIIARLRAVTSAAMPDVTGDIAHFRNPEHREFLLSGLRLAMGEPDGY